MSQDSPLHSADVGGMEGAASPSKKGRPRAVALASIAAVALWSLKPVFISAMEAEVGYAETYLLSGSLALLISVVVACTFLRASTASLVRARRSLLPAVGWAAVAGIFLGMWYFGFYRALHEAPKADATIIAFTWPLIAIIAVRVLSPGTAAPLRGWSWGLIALSFAGVAAISATGSEDPSHTAASGILWAIIAAVGSGMYLPFAMKSLHHLSSVVGSSTKSTFYSISLANLVALLAVSSGLGVTSHELDFTHVNGKVLGLCTIIGVGTYVAAEVAWTWAFQEHKSLTLASLPYLSPAVSVILLAVLFQEPVTPLAAAGLVVIVTSNLAIHWRGARSAARRGERVESRATTPASSEAPANVSDGTT